MDAQPSPDGSHIVWMSNRTGSEEIWTSDANGENPLQFSHLERHSGTPRWSPDGKWVAFDSYGSDPSHIFIVDSEGRNLRSIGNGPSFSVVPSWSRDSKCIFFSSGRTGNLQLWKHFLDTGEEVQMTQNGGFDGFESLDGQTLYFSKFDRPGIWSMPAKGGTESVVVAKRPQIGFWGYWALTESGIYFLDFEAEPRPSIDFYSFLTRRISPVLAIEKKPARLQASLGATADGKTLYYTQNDRESVIKMIEISH
jgi:dipeptidyl aminopeptidase/acylaminoacyl peptidase